MRALGKLVRTTALAVRMYFTTLVTTVGSSFVGAVFGVYVTGPPQGLAAPIVAAVVILLVLGLMGYALLAPGVSDEELRLRQQAAAFGRHLKEYKDGLPSDEAELADLRKATRALRLRVADNLTESEHNLRAAERRTRQLTLHLEDIRQFEERLKERG